MVNEKNCMVKCHLVSGPLVLKTLANLVP